MIIQLTNSIEYEKFKVYQAIICTIRPSTLESRADGYQYPGQRCSNR